MRLGRIFSILYLGATALLVHAQGSQNQTFIDAEIAQIPACGLGCLALTIPAVGCDILNTTCQCLSTELVTITAKCMMANCTLPESLELSKITAAVCERPFESRNREIRIMTIVTMTITYAAVALRLIIRYCLHQNYGLDDWFIIAAAVTDFVFTYFGIQFEHHGFGEHVWEISSSIIPDLLYWFYLCEIFYVITICLVKISILFFYLHVFPKKSFRLQCWATMAFCATSGFAFTLTAIFQCHPVSFVWDKNLEGGKCVNFNSVTWVNAAFNILQDIIIVLLPVSEVRKLQLGRKKKIGLYIMFSLGGFVCITSMVRLSTLRTFGLTADPTWDNIPTTLWTTLETTAAMLCTCLPSMRAGLLRAFPKVFDSSTNPITNPTSRNLAAGYQANSNSFKPGKFWPAQELNSFSSLSIVDEESQRGRSKSIASSTRRPG